MYKYLVIVFAGLPLVGLAFLEMGAYAPSLGVRGYPNGASLAYALYALTLAYVATLVIGWGRRPGTTAWRPVDEGRYRSFLVVLVGFELVLLLVFLFGFDAIRVWQGEVGKGEFRVSFGAFGALAYFFIKLLLPALFAFATALYAAVPKGAWNRTLWLSAFVLAFLIGSCWGFKATSVSVVLPAFLLLFWRMSFAQFASFSAAAVAVFGSFAVLFDSAGGFADIAKRLAQRLTVMQGDVAWGIWEQYRQGVSFPSYLKTLTVVIGDRLFSWVTGITRSDFALWVEYHYDLLVTHLSGAPLEQIEAGHSLTGTPFAEGVIALGFWGAPVFGALAGLMVGALYLAIDLALRRGSLKTAAVLAAYFCSFGLGWLSGGAIVQLAHISVVLGVLLTYALMSGLDALRVPSIGALAGQLRSNRL